MIGLGQDLLDQQARRELRQETAGQLRMEEVGKGSPYLGTIPATFHPTAPKAGESRRGTPPLQGSRFGSSALLVQEIRGGLPRSH